MHTSSSTPVALAPRNRFVCALGACGAAAATLGLTLALFAADSSSPWLPDTPQAAADAAVCKQAGTRSARDRCMQQTVARWQAPESRAIRLSSSR